MLFSEADLFSYGSGSSFYCTTEVKARKRKKKKKIGTQQQQKNVDFPPFSGGVGCFRPMSKQRGEETAVAHSQVDAHSLSVCDVL